MAENLDIEKCFIEIDNSYTEFLEFASGMIQIPSVNPPGDYEEISQFVYSRLNSIGFACDLITTPQQLVEAEGYAFPRKNVTARLRGRSPNRCGILCAHLDTVPVDAESHWNYAPFGGEIAGGKLWGRGACDCKGRIASFALAMAAIKNAGITLDGDVILAATADEEVAGKLGAGYLVNQGHLNGDFCILEGFINQMLYGYAGVLHLKIAVHGKSSHTATLWRGINAIQKTQKVMGAIGEIQENLANNPSEFEELKYTTINIGTIRGGTKASIVPDNCEIELDCRLVPEDSPEKILDLLQDKLDYIGADDSQFSYDLKVLRQNQAYKSDPQSILVKTIQGSLEIAGYKEIPIPVLMSRGGGDMRYFIEKGIPCVAFGPCRRPDSNIHGTDEYLTIEDFILASKATAATLIKLLSG